MRFNVEMPLYGSGREPARIVELSRALEDAGFSMLGFTDHPAPTRRWIETGGHPTYDPFAALTFVAGVTERIGLMTYLAVLPYRNPLVTARSVATVDRLSGGRFTLVVGSGYLKGEFFAVGSPFDERNDRVDEALTVLTSCFGSGSFDYEGQGWSARGIVFDPGPVQLPHPPIWVGGSSRASRRRVARWGQGWAPLMTTEQSRLTTRSAVMATIDELAARIRELKELTAAEGRDPSTVAVQIDGFGGMQEALSDVAAHTDLIAELAGSGVTDLLVRPPHDESALDAVRAYGEEIITGVEAAS